MAEQELSSGPAAVYNYEPSTSSWKAVDGGISSVAIYHNPSTGLYRAVINSAIYPDLTLKKLSDNFLSWPDATTVYGVNFADVSDAGNFIEALNQAIEACKTEVAPAAPVSKPSAKGGIIGELNSKLAKKPAASSSPITSTAKPTAVAVKPAAAVGARPTGAAGAKPTAADGKGSLRDGAAGWAAARPPGGGSSRKDTSPASTTPAATVSTPAAKPVAKPAASTYARLMGSQDTEPAPTKSALTSTSSGRDLISPRKDLPASGNSVASSSSSSSSSGAASVDYDALKQEMMSAFREELERARQEILDAVREVRGL